MGKLMHTPGPWRAGYASEAERKHRMLVRAEEQDGQPYVAVCPSWDGRHEANARLIAAAPDLLMACLAMLGTWGDQDDDMIIASRDMAKAAIAKATGINREGELSC